jgi:hypothetical protein
LASALGYLFFVAFTVGFVFGISRFAVLGRHGFVLIYYRNISLSQDRAVSDAQDSGLFFGSSDFAR